jgi:carbon-monoxide dehydrogenase iron sulfur subunit
MNYVQFHQEKCIACDLCSDVCSLSKLDRVQPSGACIRVTRDPSEYMGSMRCSVCDMALERACVESCPEEALVYDDEAGVVRFQQELCSECGNCLDACPNVHLDEVTRRIMICDLCDGDPQCVRWCPEGALTWEGLS